MPADISYLCSVSPPFAYGNTFLSIQDRTRSYYTTCSVLNAQPFNRMQRLPLKALKPCLKIMQQSDVICQLEPEEPSRQTILNKDEINFVTITEAKKPSRKGKRVTFADTHGGALTLIKYLTESTNEPPKSLESGELVRDLVKKLSLTTTVELSKKEKETHEKNKFLLQFDQPVADYVRFRRKIDMTNISLENVILKENFGINGTVKVKNIAFDKSVSIRVTFDDWNSYSDEECHYVKNAYENGIFDTFQFNIVIPKSFCPQSNKIKFCIRYKCGSEEFWDNNEGKNFVIVSSNYSSQSLCQSQTTSNSSRSNFINHHPSTYNELPGPQESTWLNMEGSGPFY